MAFDTASAVPFKDLYETYYKPSTSYDRSTGYERPVERSYEDTVYSSSKYDDSRYQSFYVILPTIYFYGEY